MKTNTIVSVIISVVIFLGGLAVFSAAFVIPEGRQAVITQFGRPIRTITAAGLHWKIPFLQDYRMIDARILNWDGYPNQIPTKDKKYIIVDTTARWKIEDPLKFIQTVQNERGAQSRLDAILDGITRDIISSHNLVEAVRNSNGIFDTIQQINQSYAQKEEAGETLTMEEEELTGEIEKIEIGREKLSQLIVEKARQELIPLGIQLIDVQLRRISYEKSVQQKVYLRMISERQRIAEKIRSLGKGERAKIQGKTEKDLRKIKSEAYKKVQLLKGEAEAKATSIYAKAFSQDREFFRFLRNLEAYENTLGKETQMILSTDSKFWRTFNK